MGRRKYWAGVARRAWREALAAGPWSSPVRLTAALASVAATVVGAWLATRTVTTAALWGLAAVATITLLTFGYKLVWALPADLAGEADIAATSALACKDAEVVELRAKLATYANPTHDEGLHSATAYVAAREWRPSIWEVGDDDPLSLLGGGIRQIADKALNSDIHIWGRANPQSRHVKIPPEFWEHGNIMIETMLNDPQHPMITTTKYGAHTPSRYHDLRISKVEFEREWPKTA